MGILLAVGAALLAAVMAAATAWQRAADRRSGAGLHGEAAAVADEPDVLQVRLDRSVLLRRISDAFDLAVDDAQVHAAAGRSLARLQRDRRTELLCVDPLTAALRPVARSAGPNGELAACPVRSSSDCPSMRRAQPLVVGRSDDVDACAFLLDRVDGACSAACVPVAVDGRSVGVVHVVGPVGSPPDADELAELVWLAGRTGSALGRSQGASTSSGQDGEAHSDPVVATETPRTDPAVAEPEPVELEPVEPGSVDPRSAEAHAIQTPMVETHPAEMRSTEVTADGEPVVDPVSGLPGAAALRSRVEALVAQQLPFVLVLADVDGLERINRDLGHAAGDESIRALVSTLGARGGPSSFAADRGDGAIALVCPGLTLRESVELVEGVRCDLLDRVLLGTSTAFTCSFGITHSRAADDADGVVLLAEAGVRRAKELGGDEIVYADETLSPRA